MLKIHTKNMRRSIEETDGRFAFNQTDKNWSSSAQFNTVAQNYEASPFKAEQKLPLE